VHPPHLAVSEGTGLRATCAFTAHAAVVTGGLHGAVAFPRERYSCAGGGPFFVGVTIIDDQDYRPRRCIWAHPSLEGELTLHFPGVPMGKQLRGYAGLSYFLARDGVGTPVELSIEVNGREVGRYVHQDERGWRPFNFTTATMAGTTADVEFVIRSASPDRRDFCFYAETL
jgi:hypothetical protein